MEGKAIKMTKKSKSPFRRYLEILLKKHKDFIKDPVLNVGGGARPYRELALKMINLDLYPEADIKADITKPFPFEAKKFKTVICTQVLQYIPTLEKTLDEIHRVLDKDGHLILSVPFLERFHGEPNDYWRFTKRGIERLIENNFIILKLIPIGGRYLGILNFLYRHRQIPRLVVKMFYPFVCWLTKREKHKEAWTPGYFIIAKKK